MDLGYLECEGVHGMKLGLDMDQQSALVNKENFRFHNA
jgi:hypothetical protein